MNISESPSSTSVPRRQFTDELAFVNALICVGLLIAAIAATAYAYVTLVQF